ncbi:MAG: glutamate-cysteine ligase family protein, partial [Candidatus Heimdallarchaeota archaeon]
GYNIQPLGFNPFQSEYRAGVTCGEHHHLGGFKTLKEKKAIYNMIRAYIPHLIALSSTSPFIEGKPTGRTLLKKGSDGRTMVLAPDCTRSIRLRENSGQLGPNISEYLPYVGPSFTQQQFSRYVRKEIPDDRYVDAYPFTTYGTIELRFFDAQYDQRIRMAIIILLQAIALKGAKYVRSGNKLPEVKGNTLYEHRKRAVNFGMFAKFQGDPSIESEGGAFVKYYNHNPDTGGPPGKIFESLKSLLIWLKPELAELHVTEEEIAPLLIMLYGTARIAPPISATTFMFYLYEQNHGNISAVIKSLSLLNGKPRKAFCEVLGRPSTTLSELFNTKVAQPKRITDSTKSSLARKLQVESRSRRKTAMAKERARLKAKQSLKTKMLREKVKKDKMLEQQRLQRLKKLEKAKKPPPRVVSSKSISTLSRRPITQPKRKPSGSTKRKSSQIRTKPSTTRTSTRTAISRKPVRKTPVKSITRKTTSKQKAKKPVTKSKARRPTSKQTTARKPTSKKTTTQSKRTKVISQAALRSKKTSAQSTKKKPQAYASTASSNYSRKQISYPKPKSGQKTTTSHIVRRKTTVKKAVSTRRTTTSVADQEEYKDFKFIRNVSIANYPNRIDYGVIIPAVRIRWKRSILQSMIKLPVSVEAEVSAINKSSRFRKTVFQEKINLENAALRDECYLPIPINLNNAIGEFQIKFIVRNLKDRKILATTYRYLTKIRAKT